MITVDTYILYGYLSFISLLLVVLLAAVIRLNGSVNKLTVRIDNLEQGMVSLKERFDNLQAQINVMSEDIAEILGLMRALHDRLDQLTRHHHDEAGRVVIVPSEAPAAD